jgi:hypothetical protein
MSVPQLFFSKSTIWRILTFLSLNILAIGNLNNGLSSVLCLVALNGTNTTFVLTERIEGVPIVNGRKYYSAKSAIWGINLEISIVSSNI